VLDVHGGAWVRGNRHSDQVLDRALAEAGFLVVAVDFRQPPRHIFPASSVDVHAAIRWLKTRAAELGGIPGRVAALGSSSGAQVALLVGLRPFDKELAAYTDPSLGNTDASLACVLACWPIVDPTARYAFAKATGRDDLVANHHQTFVPFERMDEGNPRLVVERGEAQQLPPVLILQGTNDRNVTPEIQEGFRATYAAAGGTCELAIFPDLVHGFGNHGGDDTHLAVQRIVPFLNRYLATG
jgi:acetyl esterase/lipase